ncbi:MAG: TolC family protein [Treponemataceae bacterium]
MNRKQFALVLTLVAGSIGQVFAQTALTIDQAVDAAIRNNLSLQRTKATTAAKKRASDLSWNSLIPSVNAKSAVSKANAGSGAATDWTPTESISASVSLSPSIVSSMRQAKTEYESGLLDYDAAKKSLDLSTRKTFNHLLLYKAQIEVYERKIETAKSQYDETAAKARVGQASQVEVLSAQVAWEKLKPTLKSAFVSYENSLDDFKLMIGLPVENAVVLDGKLEANAKINAVSNLERVGEPETVTTLKKSLELRKIGKKVYADQTLMPSLNLSFSSAPTYSYETWTDAGSFSASVGLNLDGFLPWSSAQETLSQYDDSIESLSSQITEARLTADATVRQLRRSIEKSFNSIDALVLNVQLAEKSYAMYEESYKKGTSDLQSLKDSGDTLVEARVSVLEERYTLLNAILDLENALNLPFATIGRK